MSLNNYVPYHVHTMLSNGITNIDSITDFHSYVDKAKEYGIKAFGFSEHGSLFGWVKKKEYIESNGMKYIHAIEVYLTEDNDDKQHLYSAIDILSSKVNSKGQQKDIRVQFYESWDSDDGKLFAQTIDNKSVWIDRATVKDEGYKKNRDNYHVVLIAKNYEGVKELNKLVSKSFNRHDFHFYYMPRISLDELFATSDNIIITSACLGGVLYSGIPTTREKFLNFMRTNKHRCFLEIQHHNCDEQTEYNKLLYQLHIETGIPLIAGTDTHALNDEHMDGRYMLQMAKSVYFANEEQWDLTFKSYDELVAAYRKQNALPMNIVYEAINNTNVLANMVDEFQLDYSAKYPKLYEDSEKVFQHKINAGVKQRNIKALPNYKDYVDRIHYEYDVYKHNGAIDFMLLEENYKTAMRDKGIKYGYSRGSVSGSIIAYLLGITEIDSIKYNLNFERFMNKERVSLADVDTDWLSEDRKCVKDYLYQKDGLYCCDIVTFNTIALKGAIKDVCRGMYNINVKKMDIPQSLKDKMAQWEKKIANHDSRDVDVEMPEDIQNEFNKIYLSGAIYKEVPYDYLRFSEEVIALAEADEMKARKKYPNIFKYVDLVNGVVVSVGNHPAGCVVSPYPVDEWFGTFTTTTDEYPISMLNMKEIDALNFVKLDILGLDNIGLIYKTCDIAGIPFATPDNIPPDDMNVWNSIKQDTTMIFQWESQSATNYLKQLFSDNTINKIKAKNPNTSYMDLLSIGNGAIRPAGESYRDQLAKGIYQDNGHEALNNFLASTLGYLVYQEQVIEFLHLFCGYTMGEADIVRRGFAKKTGTEKFIPKIKEGFTKTMLEKYNVQPEESDKIIVNFIKVIEDASSYLFSKNHADPYSWIGYICGYLRYHYPLEFITTALNIFEGKEDKSMAILKYAMEHGIKILPIKFRHSVAKYNFDRLSNAIFKGISSIKYMNDFVANELYALRNNTYQSFIDLLIDIKEKTTLDSRQLIILIETDFFEEFGDANTLLLQNDVFNKYYKKTNFKKDEILKSGIAIEFMRSIANKETDKMFIGVDVVKMIRELLKHTKVNRRLLSERIKAQIKHLGYISIIDDRYSGMACVLSIDTKYSPKLKMYSLKNGTTLECKIDKKTFNKDKLHTGDIVRIKTTKTKPKVTRTADGTWENVPDTKELWITSYIKVENI